MKSKRIDIDPTECSDFMLIATYNYHKRQSKDLSLPTNTLIFHLEETWSFLKEIAKRGIKEDRL